jgi:hypothetical protein
MRGHRREFLTRKSQFQYLNDFDEKKGMKKLLNKRSQRKTKKLDANVTWCSQAVTHPSTIHAQRCLTSVIGRELVHST